MIQDSKEKQMFTGETVRPLLNQNSEILGISETQGARSRHIQARRNKEQVLGCFHNHHQQG